MHFGMVGRSTAMLDVYQTIEKIAPTNNKIIIYGATGTGKELVARAIHKLSHRANERLVICNCSHRPPDLVESELFGHLRGSFTGAVADRIGLFEYADNGTLFLDEVGDLDLTTQGKLLRVLETGEMQRIGSPESIRVNVRLICATHRNLQEMVDSGKFRKDLYFRLKGVTIMLPELRERRDDIPALVDYFIENHCMNEGIAIKVFEPAARDVLVEYDWPGNVRQLMDTIQSLIDLSPSQFITGQEVARYLAYKSVPANGHRHTYSDQVREFKKKLLIKHLDHNSYNVRATARELAIDPSNLRKLIKDLDIGVGPYRPTQPQSNDSSSED
jgi:two-component system nitrogen regulation response regulator NtrX